MEREIVPSVGDELFQFGEIYSRIVHTSERFYFEKRPWFGLNFFGKRLGFQSKWKSQNQWKEAMEDLRVKERQTIVYFEIQSAMQG